MKATQFLLKDRLLTAYFRSNLRGFSRLWQLMKGLINVTYINVVSRYGTVFCLNPENYIDAYVIRSGYYESEVLEAILPFLNSGAVFWDVGANFGLHSITAKYLKPEVQVICIEPSPSMLTQIQNNCYLNRLRVETIAVALADRSQFQSLHLVEGNPGMSTLKPWEKATYSNRVTCYCESGDNLIRNKVIPPPTVIKLDIEGSELDALLGMRETLANEQLQAIVFEADRDLLEQPENPIYKILTEFRFSITPLIRNEDTHHALNNFIAKKLIRESC